MPLHEFHRWLGWAVIVICGVSGAWVAIAHFVEPVRSRAMWLLTHVAHVLVAAQVIVGTILAAGRTDEVSQNHMFYGSFVAVGLVVAYRHLSEYRYLLYGLGNLFIMGLAIRAFTLNPLLGG